MSPGLPCRRLPHMFQRVRVASQREIYCSGRYRRLMLTFDARANALLAMLTRSFIGILFLPLSWSRGHAPPMLYICAHFICLAFGISPGRYIPFSFDTLRFSSMTFAELFSALLFIISSLPEFRSRSLMLINDFRAKMIYADTLSLRPRLITLRARVMRQLPPKRITKSTRRFPVEAAFS